MPITRSSWCAKPQLLEALEDANELGAVLETSLLERPAARAIVAAADARDRR
jgi:hypothetical protein